MYLLPVPVIGVEMECECGATIEVCTPAEVARKHGIGCVISAVVYEDCWMEQSAEYDEAVEVNICPFCGRMVSEDDIHISMWENANRGKFPNIYWVQEEAVCEYCGEGLDEVDIKARMKEMREVKLGRKYYEALTILQSLQAIKCRYCSEEKYFCAYCRRNHVFGSKIYFEHRRFAVKRKSAIREARKVYREITESDERVLSMRRDTFRAFRAILEKKGDEILAEKEWGARCSIKGKILFIFLN